MKSTLENSLVGKSISSCISICANYLRESGVENHSQESRWLLEHALNENAGGLLIRSDQLSKAEAEAIMQVFVKRANGYPLQYILNNAVFMGMELYVDENVLIPRADTEVIANKAIEMIGDSRMDVLDICTGSGCIAIAIKRSCPQCSVSASDKSNDALLICEKNAHSNCAEIALYKGDLFESLEGKSFDIVTCNPPYIKSGDMPALQREVRFEPALALDGGSGGLHFYRRLLNESPEYLKPGGLLIVENGDGQTDDIKSLMTERFFLRDELYDSLALPRGLCFELK